MELIKAMVLLFLCDEKNPVGVHLFGKTFNMPKEVIKEGRTLKLICSEGKQLPFEIKQILWHEGDDFIRVRVRIERSYASELAEIPFSGLMEKGWTEL